MGYNLIGRDLFYFHDGTKEKCNDIACNFLRRVKGEIKDIKAEIEALELESKVENDAGLESFEIRYKKEVLKERQTLYDSVMNAGFCDLSTPFVVYDPMTQNTVERGFTHARDCRNNQRRRRIK